MQIQQAYTKYIGHYRYNLTDRFVLSLVQKGKDVYYYRDKRECDFVIKEGKRVTQAIQVSYTMEANREREIQGLCAAMDEFKLGKGSSSQTAWRMR